MAFSSLADELANADLGDDGGRSLADEFGLDLDWDEGGQDVEDGNGLEGDLEAELGHHLGSSLGVSGAEILDRDLDNEHDIGYIGNTTQTSISPPTPPDPRTPPSLFSDLQFLDNPHEPILSKNHLSSQNLRKAPSKKFVTSPNRYPKIERDPLVVLEETLGSLVRLSDILRNVDEKHPSTDLISPQSPISPSTSPTRNFHSAPSHKIGSSSAHIEDQLQNHLTKMLAVEKKMDEQIRQLSIMGRQLDLPFSWDTDNAPSFSTTPSTSFSHPNLSAALSQVEETEEGDDEKGDQDVIRETEEMDEMEIGWSGTPSSHEPPDSPIENYPISFTHPLALPHTTQSLVQESAALIETLHHLHESLSQTTSLSTSISRTLRGIRSGIELWKERDSVTEIARIKIEEYERKELERGLRGTGIGKEGAERDRSMLSVKEQLDLECREFEEKLDSWGEKMGMMRMRQEICI